MLKRVVLVTVLMFMLIVPVASAVPIGGTDNLPSYFDPNHIGFDSSENVNWIVNNWDNTWGPVYLINEFEYPKEPEVLFGTYDVPTGVDFVSFKYDSVFEVWHVTGQSFVDFGPWDHALSHYREWGPNPVPEPATMLLFGVGLIGLATVNRRRIKVNAINL